MVELYCTPKEEAEYLLNKYGNYTALIIADNIIDVVRNISYPDYEILVPHWDEVFSILLNN